MEKLETVALSLGSNLGDRKLNIELAISLLKEHLKIERVSSYFETEPLGFFDTAGFFLNLGLTATTNLNPHDLLSFTQGVEKKIGRNKKTVNGNYESRKIDIDIIFYSDKIVEDEELIIPHKYFKDRLFVLEPLNQIAPSFIDPKSKKTVQYLFNNCQDLSRIIEI